MERSGLAANNRDVAGFTQVPNMEVSEHSSPSPFLVRRKGKN